MDRGPAVLDDCLQMKWIFAFCRVDRDGFIQSAFEVNFVKSAFVPEPRFTEMVCLLVLGVYVCSGTIAS